MSIHTTYGFKFTTKWGGFKIGDRVRLSREGRDNDSYEQWVDKDLIIDWVDTSDTGMGEVEPIMSFSFEDGKSCPCSLYGYEIEKI